eukprot:1363017-Amphidinium_carterae.2
MKSWRSNFASLAVAAGVAAQQWRGAARAFNHPRKNQYISGVNVSNGDDYAEQMAHMSIYSIKGSEAAEGTFESTIT